jgi:hypothetical protein
MNGRIVLVTVATIWGSVGYAAAADIIMLRGGKSLSGLIVDHRSDDSVIKLRTARSEIPVLRSVVERIERDSDAEARYWLAREYFDETASGLFELALWCDANKLDDKREEHLNAVLLLDPDHAEARRLLGYVRRGRAWVRKETADVAPDRSAAADAEATVEASRPDAKRREQTEEIKRRQETLLKQQELARTVVRLVSWLEAKNADRIQQARAELAEIRDPLAIGPLTKAMGTASDPTRLRLIQAIGDIPATEASYALAITAVVDLSGAARGLAVELLKKRPDQRARYLPVIEQGLRSDKPGMIYNAAEALAELDQKGSMPGLIDALYTPVRATYITGGYTNLTTYPRWVPETKLVDVWTGPERTIPVYCPP